MFFVNEFYILLSSIQEILFYNSIVIIFQNSMRVTKEFLQDLDVVGDSYYF